MATAPRPAIEADSMTPNPGSGPAGRPASLRRAVLGVGGALALVVWSALAVMLWYGHGHEIETATERNVLLSRVFADGVTRNIESTAQATASLAASLARGVAPDSPEMRGSLSQLLNNLPFLRGVGIVDAQAVVRGSTDRDQLGQQVPMAALGPLPVQERDALGGFVPGRGLVDAGSASVPAGVGFLPLWRVVQPPSGEPLAVIALINVQAFINTQQATLDDPTAAAALLDYRSRLIAATSGVPHPVGADLTGLPPFTQFLPQREFGHWAGNGLRPEAQMAAFRVSATRPLVVLVERDRQAALAGWRQLVIWLIAAGLAATAVIALLTWLSLRSLSARESARAERDAAQRAVAHRERELSITLRSLQEVVFRTDVQGRLTFANARWADLTGADPAQARGRPVWHLVVPEQRDEVRALFADDGGTALRQTQACMRDAQGHLRSFDIAVMPLMQAGRPAGFAGSAKDVTERNTAQERLRTQLAFTEALMDNSPLPMSVVDLAGRYLRVNRSWESFMGRQRAQVIGQPVGSHLSKAERAVHEAQDQALLATGQPQRYESSLLHADGSLRDVLISKVLLPGATGQPAGVLSVLTDVTDFRIAERATREARDAAEETSRAKSEFVANISHELRTPLQSIIGFSELGMHRGKAHERLAGMFSDIHAAGERMFNLVNDLLDVSKIESTVGTIHLERVDLRGLVRGLLREFEPMLLSRGLAVDLALPEYPLTAKVDPLRMQQVLRNVLANALKFSPAGSHILMAGEVNEAGEPHLWVRDRGPGIPPAELEAVFDPFVQSTRTKDGSGGTGLGLAICRKIVEAHGGRIQAENAPDGGAVFHVVLPARGNTETLPMDL